MLRNTRNVKYWICTSGGIEMSMISIKLRPAFRGAESPQLLLISHGTEKIQHFKKKQTKTKPTRVLENQVPERPSFVVQQTYLFCSTAIQWLRSSTLCGLPKYSSEILDSVLLTKLDDALSFSPGTGEQSEQCSCYTY